MVPLQLLLSRGVGELTRRIVGLMIAAGILAAAIPAYAVPMGYFPPEFVCPKNYIWAHVSPDCARQEQIALTKLSPAQADGMVAPVRPMLAAGYQPRRST